MNNILWVDDEPEYLLNYKEEIERQLGVCISFAQDIPMSIKKIDTNIFSLIILDLLLPLSNPKNDEHINLLLKKYHNYTGIVLVEILKQNKRHYFKKEVKTDIPIIICSSYDPKILADSYSVLRDNCIFYFNKDDLTDINRFIELITELLDNKSIPTPVPNSEKEDKNTEEIKRDEVLEFYQKVRHDFLNYYSSINAIFDNTINYFRLNPNCYPASFYANPNKFEDVLRTEITRIVTNSTKFTESFKIANLDVGTNEQIIGIERILSRFESYIKYSDSFQFYQLRAFLIELVQYIENLVGAFNNSIKKQIVNDIKMLLAHIVLFNLNEGKSLISEYLINSISDQYALTDNPKRFQIKNINIIELLSITLRECKVVADYHKIIMEFQFNEHKVIKISGNSFAISKAIKNLLLNAIKYSERITKIEMDPWIRIRVNSTDEFCFIYIENWGIQIPLEEIQANQLFDKNHRGDIARKKRSGLGFGLYEAKKLISIHGGDITLDSKKMPSGKGLTTFIIKLPLSENA